MNRRDELVLKMQEALDADRPLDAATLAEIERDPELRRLHADLHALDEALAADAGAMPEGLHKRIAARVAREPLPRRRSILPAVAAVVAFAAGLAAALLLRAPEPEPPHVPKASPPRPDLVASIPLPKIRISGELARRGEAVRRAGVQPFETAGRFLAGIGRLVPDDHDDAPTPASTDAGTHDPS